MSMIDELSGGAGGLSGCEKQAQKRDGVALAVVTNIKDPQNLGRVKCRCITDDDNRENDWCYVMTPFAGKKHGLQFSPNVGDLVVLAYLNGDPQRPFVLGSFWNKKSQQPYPVSAGKNEKFCIKTPAGSELLFSEEKGKEKISVTTPAGATLLLDDEKKAVVLSDKEGKNALKMDLKGGAMEISAAQKLILKAGETTITLESSGKVTVKASNTVAMEAATVSAKATNKLVLQGTQTELKADGKLDLQASGVANLKGSLVNIN